jgi:hypothetical protein
MKMNKAKKKRWIWVVVALSVTILISIPVIINCLYLKGANLKAPNISFSANELLGFYGSVLVLIGTVFLGIIALVQNRKIYSKSEKAEHWRFTMANFPLFSFEKLESRYYDGIIDGDFTFEPSKFISNKIPATGYIGSKMIKMPPEYNDNTSIVLFFTIRNIGTTLAIEPKIRNEVGNQLKNATVKCMNEDEKENDRRYILPNCGGNIMFCVPLNNLVNGKTLIFKLTYSSPFFSLFTQEISMKMLSEKMILFDMQMSIKFCNEKE